MAQVAANDALHTSAISDATTTAAPAPELSHHAPYSQKHTTPGPTTLPARIPSFHTRENGMSPTPASNTGTTITQNHQIVSTSPDPPSQHDAHTSPPTSPAQPISKSPTGSHSSTPHTLVDTNDHSPSPNDPALSESTPSAEHARLSHTANTVNVVPQFADMSLTPHMHYPPPMHMFPMHHLPLPPPHHPAHMSHHRNHHLLQQHQPNTFYLWVPQDRVGAVIGGHGAVIKSLQERSGATIQVHNDTVQGDLKLFTIFGTVSQYETARQLVNDIVERPRPSRPSSHAGSVSSERVNFAPDHVARSTELCKTVYIPTSCVGLVIGRGGETIRNLQNKSGAEIKVTPDEDAVPGSDTRSILISGSEEAIAAAHRFVSEIVMEARSRRPPNAPPHSSSTMNGQPTIMEYLSVPNEKVGLIIGKRGAAIRDLQQKSGAKIQVTKDDSSVQSDGTRPVTITGIRSQVEQAKKLIAAKINMPLPTTLVTSPYVPASQPPSNVQSPSVPTHSLPYMVPNVYDAAPYPNGHHQPFQQVYDTNDPNTQGRAMAYVPYFGYNNYAVLAQQQQQRHFEQAQQQQVPMQYAHLPPVGQPTTSITQQQDQQPPLPPEQQEATLQSQYQTASSMPQPHGNDGIQSGTGVSRDANGSVLMYPQQQYQQMSHHVASQQLYPSAQNAHVYSQREHAQAVHAHTHAHILVQVQAQAAAQARQQNLGPTDDPTRTEVSEQRNG